jgi:hypothetical protein
VIPQGRGCNSPRACATAYPSCVKQGLMFVRPIPLPNAFLARGPPAEVDTSTVPIVEELEQEGWVSQVRGSGGGGGGGGGAWEGWWDDGLRCCGAVLLWCYG